MCHFHMALPSHLFLTDRTHTSADDTGVGDPSSRSPILGVDEYNVLQPQVAAKTSDVPSHGTRSSSHPRQIHLQQEQQHLDVIDPPCVVLADTTRDFNEQAWNDCINLGPDTSYPPAWPLEYSVPGSQFDMNGELDWFLTNTSIEREQFEL